MTTANSYNPKDIEQKLYEKWEAQGYFKANYSPDANNYSIVIPPPNVTGSLHMGHAFQQTLMDVLIRYHRMQGDNTLWQGGSDHAGIATQMLVERKVAAEEQKSRHDYGREAFIDKIWEWKNHSGNMIYNQMRRLGNSLDWERDRFTMDDGLSEAVKEVFVRLYDEGLIYRGKRLVNWDPQFQTAISDLEVENKLEQGFMYHVRYPFVDKNETFGDGYMYIATTRPETILADGALAVHPDDERYKDVIGKMVHVPLTDRVIPIVADTYPDPEFGTGCVKITPAHDFNDWEVGTRHEMEIINLLNPDASMSDAAPEAYRGLDRFVARDKIIEDLKTEGYLQKIEPHQLNRPYGDRSGVVIEPFLTDQWYVKVAPLAKEAIEAVEDGRIEFVPKQYENLYFSWMRDIKDWCISRQLWWGHRIPAWFDKAGKVYVGRDENEVRAKYNLAADIVLRQDNDVLDTWFSSALWTFSTLGWPEKTPELKLFHPTNVLITGFDIIFFWVARMIMMTMHFIKNEDGSSQVPFKTVYVTGLIRDEEGQKMSKSKGNVLDPIDMIDGISLPDLLAKRTGNMMQPKLAEKIAKRTQKTFPDGIGAHGTDALRFTLAALASTGRDINWDIKRLEGYRNFCNKLYNATRYVLMNTEGKDCHRYFANLGNAKQLGLELGVADKWIISQFNQTIVEYNKALSEYRFDKLANVIYEFIWNQFCDWYLELTKPILAQNNEAAKVARATLLYVCEAMLRLAHPLIPFITEELWQKVKPLALANPSCDVDSIMIAKFPQFSQENQDDSGATDDIELLKSIIIAIRNIRNERNIAPSLKLDLILANLNEKQKNSLNNIKDLLIALAKVNDVKLLNDEAKPLCVSKMVGNIEVLIPLAGFINKEQELKTIQKDIDKLTQEIARIENKLSNQAFVAKAPAEVVAKEQEKIAGFKQNMQKLQQHYSNIEQLEV